MHESLHAAKNSFRTPVSKRLLLRTTLLALLVSTWLCLPLAALDETVWLGGTGFWSDPFNWTQNVPGSMDHAYIDDGNNVNSIVEVNGGSVQVGSLTIDSGDTLHLNNQAFFQVITDTNQPGSGMIHNDGELIVGDNDVSATLRIPDEVHLSGTGTITLTGPGLASQIFGPGHLINSGNQIRGTGRLQSSAQMGFTNQSGGIVHANVLNEELRVLVSQPLGINNSGLFMASGGGILTFFNGPMNNYGGVIEARDNSLVELGVGLEISGGTIRSVGTGSVQAISPTIENATIEGTLTVGDGNSLFLVGSTNNTGEINLINDTAGFTYLWIQENMILNGGGTVSFTGASLANSVVGGGTITNSDNELLGKCSISTSLINQSGGIVRANDPTGDFTIRGVALTHQNHGLMVASSGGTLNLQESTFDNTLGVIEAQNDSSVSLGGHIFGGTIRTVGTGLVLGPGSVADLTLDATVELHGDLIMSGEINHLGAMTVNNSERIIINSQTVLMGPGSVSLQPIGNGPTSQIAGSGSLTMEQIELTGRGLVNVDTTFNSATISPGMPIDELLFNSDPVIVNHTELHIDIDAANGVAQENWDFLDVNGVLSFQDSELPAGVVIKLATLNSNGFPDQLDDFTPGSEYEFPIAAADTIAGFNPNDFTLDLSAFANSFDGAFSVTVGPYGFNRQALYIKYGPFQLGDINQDGQINLLDVAPFVTAVSDGTYVFEADINNDGLVNLLDVTPFVVLLAG